MPKIIAEKIDWVKLGFELFAKQGATGIVVDVMAKKLKCNRSSFYWHFNSKKEFILAIIQYWMEIDTEQIIQLNENGGSAKKRFRNLIAIVFKQDPYIDFIFYLKRYAQKESSIQQLIDQIDQRRLEYVTTLLVEIGYSKIEAIPKAKLFYKYLIGYHEMLKYKVQPENYIDTVYQELSQFIKL